jgi:hypothetical protein
MLRQLSRFASTAPWAALVYALGLTFSMNLRTSRSVESGLRRGEHHPYQRCDLARWKLNNTINIPVDWVRRHYDLHSSKTTTLT